MLPPFFFLPTLNISYSNDKEFADALCNKNKDAMREFQELYSDELYFIASKFCNRGTPEDSWDYRTKTGYTIKVNDRVSDTYLWLFESIVLNRSCKFRGEGGASFEGFIKIVLNSDYTFIDWLKRRTSDSLINIPGSTGYVPKCVNVLGESYKEIYKLLRQKKSDQSICNTLEIDFMDYLDYYNIIEEKLMDSNQIHLIRGPRISSLYQSQQDDEEKPIQISDEITIGPDLVPEFEEMKKIIASFIKSLSLAEKRLMILWGIGYSTKEIIEAPENLLSNEYKEVLNIIDANSIYKLIKSLIEKSVGFVKKNFPDIKSEYGLDKKKMKSAMKTYFTIFPDKFE